MSKYVYKNMNFLHLKIFLLTSKTRTEKCLPGTFIARRHHLSLSLCLEYFLLTFLSAKSLIILKDTENLTFSVKYLIFSLRQPHLSSPPNSLIFIREHMSCLYVIMLDHLCFPNYTANSQRQTVSYLPLVLLQFRILCLGQSRWFKISVRLMKILVENILRMIFTFFLSASIDQNRMPQNDTFLVKKLDIRGKSGCLARESDCKRALD